MNSTSADGSSQNQPAQKAPTSKRWRLTLVVVGVSLAVTLGILAREVFLQPAPIWRNPLLWLWIISPFAAIALAAYSWRDISLATQVFLMLAVLSAMISFTILGFDIRQQLAPPGAIAKPMPPNQIAMAAAICAAAIWFAFVPAICLMTLLHKVGRLDQFRF